jgi:UDP-N-acetylmuramate dehydrogenase
MNWQRDLKTKIKINEPLKDKTAFKIGGEAAFFAEPKNIGQLRDAVIWARDNHEAIRVLGAGSNVLVSDKGVNGIVLKLNSRFFKTVSFTRLRVRAGGGCMISGLMREAAARSLSGLEFLAGIPGTVGGALVMNAGAWGGAISDLVEEARVMDYNGKIKVLKKNQMGFGYRSSGLDRYIVLSAVLRLSKAKEKKEVLARMKNYLEKKMQTQDNTLPSAGCAFKNPENNSAGRLIDLCGLKGRRRGGAMISKIHANFFLNRDDAKAGDVLALMELARKEVKKKFAVDLKPEIRLWMS